MKVSAFLLVGFGLGLSANAKIIKEFKSKISEPSGLAAHGGRLYTVSDQGGIYSMATDGSDIKEHLSKSQTGQADNEAITYHNGHFLVMREKDRNIVKYDENFKEKGSINVSGIADSLGLPSNSGFESLASCNGKLYIATEKETESGKHKGEQVLIEIDDNGKEKVTYGLKGLGLKDISDITCDNDGNFWVVSHESSKLVGFSKLGTPIKPDYSGKIDGNPEQAEGVAVVGSDIYIVSDRDGLLIKMAKPKL